MNPPFAEVIASSSSELTGQCRQGTNTPGFGSLILAGGPPVTVGVIHSIESASMDPHRRPSALGLSPEQLATHHPQLALLLRQNIQALLIGSLDDSCFQYGLPVQPPGVHSEIRVADPTDLLAISKDLGFLQLLHRSLPTLQEELLLRVARHLMDAARHSGTEPPADLAVRIGRSLSQLYRDDYDSLRRILERLEPWMT